MFDWRDFSVLAMGMTAAWSLDHFQSHKWLQALLFLALFFYYLGEYFNQLAPVEDVEEEDENTGG